MTVQVGEDKTKYDGMVSLPLARTQVIKITSFAKLDRLIISGCHRFETYKKADSTWYGGTGKEYKFTYTPTQIEFDEKCPLYFQALENNATTDWGYVAFKTTESLIAQVECNGKMYSSSGMTVCQTKAGYEQMIGFAVPVKHKGSSGCTIEVLPNNKFKIIPTGFCNVAFKSENNQRHSLTMLGFTEDYIR